eukprot:gene3278-1609_t
MIVHLQSTFIFFIAEFLYLSKSFYFFPAETVVKAKSQLKAFATIPNPVLNGRIINTTDDKVKNDLADPSSALYKELNNTLTLELNRKIKAKRNDVKSVTVNGFVIGSLIINFTIEFSTTPTETPAEIEKSISDAVNGTLGGASVDKVFVQDYKVLAIVLSVVLLFLLLLIFLIIIIVRRRRNNKAGEPEFPPPRAEITFERNKTMRAQAAPEGANPPITGKEQLGRVSPSYFYEISE